MQNHLVEVNVRFSVALNSGRCEAGLHRFRTLIPECVAGTQMHASLVYEAQSLIAALYDANEESVHVVSLEFRVLEYG